jgi:hypothetical protein
MAKDLMYDCEHRAQFVDTSDPTNRSKRKMGWVAAKVINVPKKTSSRDVRCIYCQGAIRIHRQRQVNGTQDHVEHTSREDSENCKGGIYFKGVHRTSLNVVQ